MNSALDNLYDDLIRQADDNEHKEELTDAEKAKRFVEEKRIAIDKLKEISLKKLENASKAKEEARMRELGRKRQDPQQGGLKHPTDTERQEKERMRRLEERTVRFWRRDVTGERRETGVLYSGESKRTGDAWVPHGHGEYRVNTEVIYEGAFCNGAMHGDGRLLLDNGETWVGKLRKDMMHGIGTLISKDDTQHRRAIYWWGRRVCFLDGEAHSSDAITDDAPRTARVAPACSPCIQELKPGCRLKLMSDEYTQVANGEGMVVSDNEAEGRYLVRLDSGVKKLLRLDCEHFRVLRSRVKDFYSFRRRRRPFTAAFEGIFCRKRHKPPVIPLDPIVEATAGKVLYDYDEDQANPKTTVYRENFFWPNLWAGQAKEKEEEQVELDLQAKRSKILPGRLAKQYEKKAVYDLEDVSRAPGHETPRKERITREDATTPPQQQRVPEIGALCR